MIDPDAGWGSFQARYIVSAFDITNDDLDNLVSYLNFDPAKLYVILRGISLGLVWPLDINVVNVINKLSAVLPNFNNDLALKLCGES